MYMHIHILYICIYTICVYIYIYTYVYIYIYIYILCMYSVCVLFNATCFAQASALGLQKLPCPSRSRALKAAPSARLPFRRSVFFRKPIK